MTDPSAINQEVQSLILDAMSQFQENQHLQEVGLEAIGTCFTNQGVQPTSADHCTNWSAICCMMFSFQMWN